MEYQYCNNVLSLIKSLEIKITWSFIEIGFCGHSNITAQWDVKSLCDELVDLIDETTTNKTIVLLCEQGDNQRFANLLKKYASEEKSDYNIQLNKWRLYQLHELLSNNENDDTTLTKMIDLLLFWASWGCTGSSQNCPMIFPNNDIEELKTPNYFTDNVYNLILEKHTKWIREEIDRINRYEVHISSIV